MKRGFAWLLTLLALLGLLSGCGGGGDTTVSDTASNSAATDGADDPGGSYGAWAEAEVAEDSGGTAEDGEMCIRDSHNIRRRKVNYRRL